MPLNFYFILAIFVIKVFILYIPWLKYSAGPDMYDEIYGACESLRNTANYWRDNGFTFMVPRDILYVNHPPAMIMLSAPLLFLPPSVDYLIPWNIFYTMVTAFSVLAMAVIEGIDAKVSKAAFYICVLSPLFYFSPTFRDTLGQAILAMGMLSALIFVRRSPIAFVVCVLSFTFLGFLFRNSFPFVYMMAVFYLLFIYKGMPIAKGSKISIIIIIIAVLFLIGHQTSYFNTVFLSPLKEYVGRGLEYQNIRVGGILTPFYRIFFGLTAPIPWTQTATSHPHYLFLILYDIFAYSQNVLGLALISMVVFKILRDLSHGIKPFFLTPTSAIFGVLIIVAGCFGTAIHNIYLQVGSIFLIPYAVQLTKGRFRQAVFWSLAFFVALNIIWILARKYF